jgi:superfamily I DNA/RNA helicase
VGLADEAFFTLVRNSFDFSSEPVRGEALTGAITEIRSLRSLGEGRPSLPECDLVALVIFAGLIAEGFEYKDQSGGLLNFFQMRKNTAVFIDEVQDFTEIEIVLMGMSATSKYNQVTLSGDRFQQLQSAGAKDFQALFPWIPRQARNNSILLDQNFRQRSELSAFSSKFRASILGDDRIQIREEEFSRAATIYHYRDRNPMIEFIISRVRSLPPHATVAVIMPTVDEVRGWFDSLEEQLGAYHRPALMSRRDDLTKRVNIHFTEVRETKGLEFDVVIIPDLGTFKLGDSIGRNQVYVAISRARQSLLIGCDSGRIGQPEIRKLEQEGLVSFREIPISLG